MTDKYVLDELGRPVPCRDFMEWALWMGEADRQLAETFFGDKAIRVSTVFLGLDHGFLSREPVLWETMIFADEAVKLDGIEDYQERYSTSEQALEGHQRACTLVEGLLDVQRAWALAQALGRDT